MTKVNQETILLVGASGYLGSIVAAGLLANGTQKIVAAIRNTTTREVLIEKIKSELPQEQLQNEIDFNRLITIDLPAVQKIQTLENIASTLGINEIMHCAGSVDYFDLAVLQEANIDLTAQLIALGKKLSIKRFVYLSTAFSSGMINGLIPETVHTEAGLDPTKYTRSKRDAEILVSNSGLPYLILRPSIVIGDSRNGRYSGKAYGLYQYWHAFERFLCDRYRSDLHFIAPRVKLHLIHQDAFQASFIAACRNLPDNTIVHLTSRPDSLPTVREVCQLWSEVFTDSDEVQFYSSLDEAPTQGIDKRTRMWLEFTAVNSDIATHNWLFQTLALDKLRDNGLAFRDATLDSVRTCRDYFVAQSSRIQTFLADNAEKRAASVVSSRPPALATTL